MYKALSDTKPSCLGEIAPLYWLDGSLTTDKIEQADLLFKGTSIVHAPVDLLDLWPPETQSDSQTVPHIIKEELEDIIKGLPKGKAKGPDDVSIELLFLAVEQILDPLLHLLNACLTLQPIQYKYLGSAWRVATMAIIRKFNKEDYSAAGAYRPIALLLCLGKVFEIILMR
ncbi:hypothetical protein CROQUDRAFT_54449 [Cronartium quercuum f. sp. fusiforme G11]|uniref:Uncharacterized protein n=1 Tax=Cronartium quercuum f. sp. fusiforme G11 TaxID=708437 RepID=A0A9P6T596_9BASI|nr:hypothetical protein CROQUDRAFT_54449 [Cronartium quercuum f. sp. fusiforme G11]